jgi:hypothetical protein
VKVGHIEHADVADHQQQVECRNHTIPLAGSAHCVSHQS